MSKIIRSINLVRLDDLVTELGEEAVKNKHLLPFNCENNPDIEFFLKEKAIEFSKRGWAKTQLVYISHETAPLLVGYFALTMGKPVMVDISRLSKGYRKRISGFAQEGIEHGKCYVTMPLIAQFSKNFRKGYDKLISGSELLQLAINELRTAQAILGGRFVYVECEEEKRIIEFYKQNGFIEFGFRERDRDEVKVKSLRLCQLLRKI